jgi:restriction system protein
MALREVQTLLLLLVGVIVFVGTGSVAVAIAGIAVPLLCFGLMPAYIRWRTQRLLLNKVFAATHEQLAALCRRRMQLVQPDAYGKERLEKWNEELKDFLSNHLWSSLLPDEQRMLQPKLPELMAVIDHTVQEAMRDSPSLRSFSDDMSPVEFEAFCAEELRQAGWNARVIMQSREQGVDVIAEKNKVRVVLQCKLYTGPVGNKALQEVAAGRAHEQADYGIVVTNNRYTAAAEQLASTNGVLLLHYRDIRKLDDCLLRRQNNRAPKIIIDERESKRLSPVLGPRFDRARWAALLAQDPQLNMVANKLRPLGQIWVDRFAASYFATNDRKRLPILVSKIIADAKREFEQGRGAQGH